MEKSNDQVGPDNEEDSIAKILRLVGPRSNMPEATKVAWSRVFGDELSQVIDKRRSRRRVVSGVIGLCASLTMLYLFFGATLQQQWLAHEALAKVTKFIGEPKGVDEKGKRISLAVGQEVFSDTTLQTSERTLLAFNLGEIQVRLNENTQVRIYPHKLQLLKGQLYIDTATLGKQGSSSILVSTPLATIRDIGTQFRVTYDATGVTTAVREGAIMVAVEEGEYRADAQAEHAQQINISKDSKVEITKSDKRGESWDWNMQLAESFSIEGRTAYEFLHWAARETGLRLIFDDDQTTHNAKKTVLHGDVSLFTPEQAIDVVLATTRLSAKRPNTHTLYISLIEE